MESKDREFAIEVLAELEQLMTYKNEIPDRIVRSTDPDNLYKIRKGWFTSVRVLLSMTQKNKLVGLTLGDGIRLLVERIDAELSPGENNPTEGHIRHASRIVTQTIRSLRNLLKQE